MKNIEIKARYIRHENLNCSRWGNPRALVVFEIIGGNGAVIAAKTATDAACGWSVGNWESAAAQDRPVCPISYHWTSGGNAIVDYIHDEKAEG